MKKNTFLHVMILVLVCAWQTSYAHGPSGHGEHPAADKEAAMKAQHERMENFRNAAQTLFDAIILSDGGKAAAGTELLQKSLEGHEKDAPHKNRQHAKEFHALYVDLGKRTEKMMASIRKKDLSKAAVSYGEVLSVCAACHRRFRD